MKSLLIFFFLLQSAGILYAATTMSNPDSVFSIALEASMSKNGPMRNFLGPAWTFLPEATSQQVRSKKVLKENFKSKFFLYPNEVTIAPHVLENFCNCDELCPHKAVDKSCQIREKAYQAEQKKQRQANEDMVGKIAQVVKENNDCKVQLSHLAEVHEAAQTYEQERAELQKKDEEIGRNLEKCRHDSEAAAKQCSEEKNSLTKQLEALAQNLNAIREGYNQIYLSNLAYSEAVRKLNNSYEKFINEIPKDNFYDLLFALNTAYHDYLRAHEALKNLNKKLMNADIHIEVSVPRASSMKTRLNMSIEAFTRKMGSEKLGLIPLL